MKSLSAVLLVTSLCSTCFGAQYAAAQQMRNDGPSRDVLVAQVDTFMHAWEKQDAAALTATMAPEFLYVSSQGVAPREGIVAALTHACTLSSYSLSEVQMVPISPDSAALIYKIHQSATCEGHPSPTVVLNTDTLIRRDGKWLFVMTTSTPAQ